MRIRHLAWFVGLVSVGCGPDEDPSSYAREVAKETTPERKPSRIVTFEPAVPRGKHVACDDLLDAGALGQSLSRPVALVDKWNAGMPATSVCVVVDTKTAAAHGAAATREDDAIGRTIGLEDALCRIEAACFDPLDAPTLARRCERDIPGGAPTTIAGAAACLAKQSTKDRGSKLMESGRVEHVKYQITAFEPDTTCQVTVYALDDEVRARTCATAAVAGMTRESIEKFQ